jgi:type I restriction enzyme R subunit
LAALEAASVHVDVLAEVLARPEADQFDLLAHIAFGKPIQTRSERAEAFLNREQDFVGAHAAAARDVILALLDKYRVGGVNAISDPAIFRLSPFREMGQAPGVITRFGGENPLRRTLEEIQEKLYGEEAV